MKHKKHKSHKSHKPARRHTRVHHNPKGVQSLEEHESLTTMQRLARLETSVRQLDAREARNAAAIKATLASQAKFNQELASILQKAMR